MMNNDDDEFIFRMKLIYWTFETELSTCKKEVFMNKNYFSLHEFELWAKLVVLNLLTVLNNTMNDQHYYQIFNLIGRIE